MPSSFFPRKSGSHHSGIHVLQFPSENCRFLSGFCEGNICFPSLITSFLLNNNLAYIDKVTQSITVNGNSEWYDIVTGCGQSDSWVPDGYKLVSVLGTGYSNINAHVFRASFEYRESSNMLVLSLKNVTNDSQTTTVSFRLLLKKS